MQIGEADGVAEDVDNIFGLPAVLCLFLSGFHRFYTGRWGTCIL